jgi:hypothetical protein
MDQPSNLEKSIKVKRLIDEVIFGEVGRSRFDIWEMDLLLDMLTSDLYTVRYATRLKVLRKYQEFACRRLEEGFEVPLRLSQYLKSLEAAQLPAEAAAMRKTTKDPYEGRAVSSPATHPGATVESQAYLAEG